MSEVARRLKIQGRVQGVSFRYYARRQVELWGIAGWIRNAGDGSVEALVQGEEEAVNRFTEWARKGPSMADVTRVHEEACELEDSVRDFRIL